MTVGKAAILAGVVRAFGYRNVVPLAVGLTLFQVGEFAFVLARVGQASGAITDDLYALVLNTAVATMALTPVVSGLTSRIYSGSPPGAYLKRQKRAISHRPGCPSHVIVAGYGRVGRRVADAMSS